MQRCAEVPGWECHREHLGFAVSDSLKVGWVWMHWWTCSEWGTSTPTQGHTCMGFPPKRAWHHLSITEWHGKIGGYAWCHQIITQWCVGDLGSCMLHQWHQEKGYKRDECKGEGVPDFGFERVQVLSYSCRIPQCVQALGLPQILHQVGILV